MPACPTEKVKELATGWSHGDDPPHHEIAAFSQPAAYADGDRPRTVLADMPVVHALPVRGEHLDGARPALYVLVEHQREGDGGTDRQDLPVARRGRLQRRVGARGRGQRHGQPQCEDQRAGGEHDPSEAGTGPSEICRACVR